MQLAHKIDPVVGVDFPVVQSMHVLDPEAEAYLPVEQDVHAVAVPVTDVNLPASQLVHDAAASAEYVPNGQDMHCDLSAEAYVPERHLAQVAAPEVEM
jgi:hypothetical protein